MATTNFITSFVTYVTVVVTILLMNTGLVFAHCDTMDGPIIKTAQKALETGDVNLVLAWIQKRDEAELKQAFKKAREVRKLNPAAKELADMYFLETFVRLHRAGEGAPYTGIKPAGTELGPAVEVADKALESGSVDNLLKLMTETVVHGVREHFEHAMALKKRASESVEAGREYVEAYVKYVHYVEKLYDDATAKTAHHGHAAEAVKHEH
jgi:Family of unknown function (DUF6448)